MISAPPPLAGAASSPLGKMAEGPNWDNSNDFSTAVSDTPPPSLGISQPL
jgi:hypothetical protein